jgi:hypothetical protein
MDDIKLEDVELVGIARMKDDVSLWVVEDYVLRVERGDRA